MIDDVVRTAESYLGTPHRTGGTTTRGIDCSGLMVQSFASVGITLPRTSQAQSGIGTKVDQRRLERGDLVFFKLRGKISHVGLVTKTQGTQVWFIHTSSSRGVMVSTLGDAYWRDGFTFGRRVWNDATITRRRVDAPALTYAPGTYPEASIRKLNRRELKRLTPREAELMQAEVWARNGYRFRDKELQRYFERQDWYRNLDLTKRQGKVKRSLSDVEKKNLRRIRRIADVDKVK